MISAESTQRYPSRMRRKTLQIDRFLKENAPRRKKSPGKVEFDVGEQPLHLKGILRSTLCIRAPERTIAFSNRLRIRLIPLRDDAVPGKVVVVGPNDETVEKDSSFLPPVDESSIIYMDHDPDEMSCSHSQRVVVEYEATMPISPNSLKRKRSVRKSGFPVLKRTSAKCEGLGSAHDVLEDTPSSSKDSPQLATYVCNMNRGSPVSEHFLRDPQNASVDHPKGRRRCSSFGLSRRMSQDVFPLLRELSTSKEQGTRRPDYVENSNIAASTRRRSSRVCVAKAEVLRKTEDAPENSTVPLNAANETCSKRRRRSSYFVRVPLTSKGMKSSALVSPWSREIRRRSSLFAALIASPCGVLLSGSNNEETSAKPPRLGSLILHADSTPSPRVQCFQSSVDCKVPRTAFMDRKNDDDVEAVLRDLINTVETNVPLAANRLHGDPCVVSQPIRRLRRRSQYFKFEMVNDENILPLLSRETVKDSQNKRRRRTSTFAK